MASIYLAGPITGLSYEDARNGWRRRFKELLGNTHIKCFSPMRGKDFLAGEKSIKGNPLMYADKAMATSKGILGRDHFDVQNCDVVVANFLGAERVSIGTCVEFGWASAYRKPVVMIVDDNNLHNHAFLHEIATYVVKTPEEAAFLTKTLLTEGV